MNENYDAVKSAIKELVAQGIFNPDDAVRFAIRDLVACGSFLPDEAVKQAIKEMSAENATLRAEVEALKKQNHIIAEMRIQDCEDATKAEAEVTRLREREKALALAAKRHLMYPHFSTRSELSRLSDAALRAEPSVKDDALSGEAKDGVGREPCPVCESCPSVKCLYCQPATPTPKEAP